MSNYVDGKSEADQSYAEWRRYWDDQSMKRKLRNKHWQSQNSYRRSIEKAVQTLRETWQADLNWDSNRKTYPLINWSGHAGT